MIHASSHLRFRLRNSILTHHNVSCIVGNQSMHLPILPSLDLLHTLKYPTCVWELSAFLRSSLLHNACSGDVLLIAHAWPPDLRWNYHQIVYSVLSSIDNGISIFSSLWLADSHFFPICLFYATKWIGVAIFHLKELLVLSLVEEFHPELNHFNLM